MNYISCGTGKPYWRAQYQLKTILIVMAISAFWLGHFVDAKFGTLSVVVLSLTFTALTFCVLRAVIPRAEPLIAIPMVGAVLGALDVVYSRLLSDLPFYESRLANSMYEGVLIGVGCGIGVRLWERVFKSPQKRYSRGMAFWRGSLRCYLLLALCYFAALGFGEWAQWRRCADPRMMGMTVYRRTFGVRVIELRGYGIGDGNLAHWLEDEEVEMLHRSKLRVVFIHTQITEKGLRQMKRYPHLHELDLRRTHISWAAVRRLRQALPDCRIRAFW